MKNKFNIHKMAKNTPCEEIQKERRAEINIIEQTKLNGAVKALKERIESLQRKLCINNWEAIIANGKYCKLGKAILNGMELLKQMKETFKELQKIENGNK